MKNKSAKLPEKLNKYMDNPQWFSSCTETALKGHTPPINTWNKIAVNPKPYSRFNEPSNVVVCKVMKDGNVINHTAREYTSLETRNEEQLIMELTRKTCRSSHSGMALVHQEAIFANNVVKPQSVNFAKIPESMFLPHDYLMTPTERREIFQFETKYRKAKQLEKKSHLDKERSLMLIKNQYPHGISGVDGPGNPNSKIYSSKGSALQLEKQRENAHYNQRKSRLEYETNSNARRGYNFLEHNNDDSKFRPPHCLRAIPNGELSSHCRIMHQEPKYSISRATNLRNEWSGGKNYDIVTGCEVKYIPSTIPEKRNRRQEHDSILIHGIYK